MMSVKPQIIEKASVVAALGMRFRDTATGATIIGGLQVTAFPDGKKFAETQLFPSRSGVYTLHQAKGLEAAFRYGAGDGGFWQQHPPAQPFSVSVNDLEARFQPFSLSVEVPQRGLLNWLPLPDASPPSPTPSVPLYSAPTRATPDGMAVIRAELWDFANQIPASWAVLEAYLDGTLRARSFADEHGRVALLFPYPPWPPSAVASPPDAPLQRVWPLELRALYDAPVTSPLSPPAAPTDAAGAPDLRATLTQNEATLWADATAATPLGTVSLHYGAELFVKSGPAPASPSAPEDRLFLSAV